MFVSRTRSAATCIIRGLLHAAFGTQITAGAAVGSYSTTAIACGPFTRVCDTSTRYGLSCSLSHPLPVCLYHPQPFSPQRREFCTHTMRPFPHMLTSHQLNQSLVTSSQCFSSGIHTPAISAAPVASPHCLVIWSGLLDLRSSSDQSFPWSSSQRAIVLPAGPHIR